MQRLNGISERKAKMNRRRKYFHLFPVRKNPSTRKKQKMGKDILPASLIRSQSCSRLQEGNCFCRTVRSVPHAIWSKNMKKAAAAFRFAPLSAKEAGRRNAGFSAFSCIRSIYRVMSGNLNQTISPEMERRVEESVEKLRLITIKIMCEEEMDVRSIGKGVHFESSLFPCVRISVRVGNRARVNGYMLYRNALYYYAESIRQIIAAPFELRSLSLPMKTTCDVIIIKDYIIQRIEIMKHVQGTKEWNRISLEWYDSEWGRMSGLLPTLGYTPDHYSRFDAKRSKVNRIITAVLECFVGIGYINGFEKVSRVIGGGTRRTVIGYDISVDRKRKDDGP